MMDLNSAYEANVDAVFGYLALRTASRRTAEDLTQETFERALRGWLSSDAGRGDEGVWLLAIARDVYIDWRRSSAADPRNQLVTSRDQVEGGDGSGVAFGVDPVITSALRGLSRREREAVALRFGGTLRTAQVAELLGVSHANAQQILSRALHRLRATLAPH